MSLSTTSRDYYCETQLAAPMQNCVVWGLSHCHIVPFHCHNVDQKQKQGKEVQGSHQLGMHTDEERQQDITVANVL